MRHGPAIYFWLGKSAEMLNWRGFYVSISVGFFLSPGAGGLTGK
jgi:hypothetical protein